MGLLDEDVSIVEAEVLAAVQPELQPKESVTVEFDRLEDLLQKQRWKEANDETMRLLLCLANRRTEDWLLVGNIRNFSQNDLNTIDALWSNASQGRFGFGIQARLFEESIGSLNISKSEAWQFFDNLVEWRKDDKNYYRFSLDAPEGHLPQWRKLIAGWGVSDRGISFLKRGLNCPIESFQSNETKYIEIKPIHKIVDYSNLQKLLVKQQWKEADDETYKAMLSALGKPGIRVIDLKIYPEDVIKKIDLLWSDASGGKFGFIAQAIIWQQVSRDKSEFDIQVGWKLPTALRGISRSQLKLNLEEAEFGHFPAFFKSWGGGGWSFTEYFLGRVCEFLDPSEKSSLKYNKAIRYEKLLKLLEEKNWKAADQETYQLMLKATNRKRSEGLDTNSLSKFPFKDLQQIDRLWMTYSQEKFGFSIQEEIWNLSSGWIKFSDNVGWRKDGSWQRDQEFFKDHKIGTFPRIWFPKHEWCRQDLLQVILVRLQEAREDNAFG